MIDLTQIQLVGIGLVATSLGLVSLAFTVAKLIQRINHQDRIINALCEVTNEFIDNEEKK